MIFVVVAMSASCFAAGLPNLTEKSCPDAVSLIQIKNYVNKRSQPPIVLRIVAVNSGYPDAGSHDATFNYVLHYYDWMTTRAFINDVADEMLRGGHIRVGEEHDVQCNEPDGEPIHRSDIAMAMQVGLQAGDTLTCWVGEA